MTSLFQKHFQRQLVPNRGFKRKIQSNLSVVQTFEVSNTLEAHTGCVNTLCWSSDGNYLLTGSDDTKLCVWNYEDYSLNSFIDTGHTGNIFDAKFLTYANNTTVVSCSADKLIKVFDVNYEGATRYNSQSAGKTCRCHVKRVKKVAPLSSHTFLSCSEDSTIRFMDLRVSHFCSNSYQKPLFDYGGVSEGLTALSVNPFDTHYILVGGEDKHVFLSDLRMAKNTDSSPYISKFSIHAYDHGHNDTITAIRFSRFNRSEFLASWSGEHIYLFDIKREIKQINDNDTDSDDSIINHAHPWGTNYGDGYVDSEDEEHHSDIDVHDNSLFIDDDPSSSRENIPSEQIDYICPIKSYKGHCNIQTVKDVNFYGPQDEYVMSGSDDGKLFIWDKEKRNVVQILTCDTEIVNCMEDHPYDPTIAVSGIDDSVKILSPSSHVEKCTLPLSDPFIESDQSNQQSTREDGEIVKYFSQESHMPNAKRICLKNERNRQLGHHHSARFDLGALLMGLYGYTGDLSDDARSDTPDPNDPPEDRQPVRNYIVTYGFTRNIWHISRDRSTSPDQSNFNESSDDNEESDDYNTDE